MSPEAAAPGPEGLYVTRSPRSSPIAWGPRQFIRPSLANQVPDDHFTLTVLFRGWAATWTPEPPGPAIVFQRFDEALDPVGPVTEITRPGESGTVHASAALPDRLGVAWYDPTPAGAAIRFAEGFACPPPPPAEE